WSEDPNRSLALADAAVEVEERAEARHLGGVRALHRDQELIVKRVARQAVRGAHPHPTLPALGAQQRARRLLESIPVGLAALGALSFSELSVSHRPPSIRSSARLVRGRFPDPPH